MSVFRINMIRNRPVPLPQRAAVAAPLLFGLFAVGVLLAWSINHAVWAVLEARQQQLRAALETDLFIQQHPRQPDVVRCAGALRTQLAEAAENLGIAEQLLTRRAPVAVALYQLTTALPPNVRLLSMEFASADHTLHFDLTIPIEADTRQTTPVLPPNEWANTPDIRNLVPDLRQESSQ